MSEENKMMTINVPNSVYESIDIASPVPYQVHQMIERSISSPDPEAPPLGWAIQLKIDEHRLAEREDEVFLAQLKEYHSGRFRDEW